MGQDRHRDARASVDGSDHALLAVAVAVHVVSVVAVLHRSHALAAVETAIAHWIRAVLHTQTTSSASSANAASVRFGRSVRGSEGQYVCFVHAIQLPMWVYFIYLCVCLSVL